MQLHLIKVLSMPAGEGAGPHRLSRAASHKGMILLTRLIQPHLVFCFRCWVYFHGFNYKDSYNLIIIIKATCIFAKFSENIRNLQNSNHYDIANYSYLCNTGDLAIIGPHLLENIKYANISTHIDSFVNRKDSFIFSDDSLTNIQYFTDFNNKYIKN